jgi:ferrous iron transport protein A
MRPRIVTHRRRIYIRDVLGQNCRIVARAASSRAPAAIPLASLPLGGRGRLCALENGSVLSRRLGELGFVPGTEVRLVRRAPLGDPIEIELRGYRVCLRSEQLVGLMVEPLEEGRA